MDRRTYLRGLFAATAAAGTGCLGSNAGETAAETTTDASDAGTETGRARTATFLEASPTASVTSADCDPGSALAPATESSRFAATASLSGPDGHASAEAAVVVAESESAPAAVEVAFRSHRPGETRYQFGSVPPVSTLSIDHAESDASLVFRPDPRPGKPTVNREIDTDGVVPDGPAGGCWVADRVPFATSYFETRTLDACEGFSRRYRVLSHPDVGRCLPAGDYETTESMTVRGADVELELVLTITIS